MNPVHPAGRACAQLPGGMKNSLYLISHSLGYKNNLRLTLTFTRPYGYKSGYNGIRNKGTIAVTIVALIAPTL